MVVPSKAASERPSAAFATRWRLVALGVLGLVVACVAAQRPDESRLEPDPEPRGPVVSDAIVVAGERFRIGAPVVLWTDRGGYDATTEVPRFGPVGEDGPTGLRYRPGRSTTAGDASGRRPTLEELRAAVDLFVLHYDVCGTSAKCFEVLHDRRGLSVHFLLDVDGTIYQTLDLADTAWHASAQNARSVGVEIAHIGAYPAGSDSPLDEWYVRDAGGVRVRFPEHYGDGGVRTAGFTPRPRSGELVRGVIQGEELEQYDFTPEQYDSLARLAAGLSVALPRIELHVPRDSAGRVRNAVLSEAELQAFSGVLGHYHTSDRKTDPGPAFGWERFLIRARSYRASLEAAGRP